ncbi:MAG: DUF1990 family protein [Acidimicrobiales bacterium]
MGIGLRPPSVAQLDERRTSLAYQAVTYEQVGATGSATLPSGYHHDRRSVSVGTGDSDWAQACRGLIEWKAHERAGVAIAPAGAALVPGTVVTATKRIGLLWVVAPCKITSVTATDDRFGFAYGTLPGHPEEGEEAFHIVRGDNGRVSFEIVAFSRPAVLLARLGGPITRGIQQRAIDLYLDGLRTFVAESA